MPNRGALLALVVAVPLALAIPSTSTAATEAAPAPLSVTLGSRAVISSQIVAGTGSPTVLSPAEIEDLGVLAKSTGQTTAELEYKYRGRQAFQTLIAWLQADHAETYADAGYTSDSGSADVYIRFTSKPSDTVLSRIALLPYSTRVESGAVLNEAENDQLTRKVSDLTSLAGVQKFEDFIDPATGMLVVDGNFGLAAKQVINTLSESIAAAIPPSANPGIVIHSSPSLQVTTTGQVRGGNELEATNGSEYCSNSFNVRVGNDLGTVTAAHCYNYMLYNNQSGVISFVKEATMIASGQYVDLQFHKILSGSSVTSDFQYNTNAYRSVTSASNAPVGEQVCQFGQGSGKQTCTTVEARNVCYHPNVAYCGMTKTTADIVIPGDSGGPWFTGNTARGTGSGHTVAGVDDSGGSIDPNGASYYAPQTQIGERLGGSILTQ